MVRARWPDRKLTRTTRDCTRGPQTAPARRRVRSLRHVQGLVPISRCAPTGATRRRRARGRCRRARLASDRWHRLARAGRGLRAEPVAPMTLPAPHRARARLGRAPRAQRAEQYSPWPAPAPVARLPRTELPRTEGRTEPLPELSFRARVASHASSEVCARARSRIGRPARDPPGRPGRQALVGASRALTRCGPDAAGRRAWATSPGAASPSRGSDFSGPFVDERMNEPG